MPSYAGPPAHRSDEIAGTLRLLVALALAIALMVLDHRGGWLTAIRSQIEVVVQTRGVAHIEQVLQALRGRGYRAERIG